jgi:Thiol-disulfide isomerase and thioredoxins
MKKNRIQLLAAALLAAGALSLSGCQSQNNELATTAVTETEAVTAESESGSGTEAESNQETGADAAAGNTAEPAAGNVAEDALLGAFQTITLEGEEINQDLFGRAGLSMINIWGTFCPPCIREMPDLAELSHEYGGDQFQMIGLVSDVMDAGNASAVEIIEQTGADYTHILISQELYDNYLYTVQVVPTTVFVDKDGRQVGDVYTGAKSKQQWEAIIKELLAETGE